MIWSTVFVWLVAGGFLVGITGLVILSTGEILALVIVPIAFGIFAFSIAGAVSGFQAAAGKANIFLSVIIAVVLGLVSFSFVTDDLDIINLESFITFAPLLAVLISYGITHCIAYVKTIHPFLYYGSHIGAFLVAFAFLYLLGAYQSQMAYLALPKELFFVQPKNDVSTVFVPNGESILVADGKPFTGVITSYDEKLTLDFFTKKESGVAYYIDGLNFGESGKTIPAGYYNSWHGSHTGTEFWYSGNPENQHKAHNFLLHKDYQYSIETEFPENKAVYYEEITGKNLSVFNPYPLPKILAVFANETNITRYTVSFHPNGVVQSIERYFFGRERLEDDDLSWKDRDMFSFDKLGYRNIYESEKIWNKNDFLETQFNSLERIKNSANNKKSILQNPDKMMYVPNPENWMYDNVTDNLVAVFGMPLTVIYIHIDDNNGHWQGLQIAEATDFTELISRSTITISPNFEF